VINVHGFRLLAMVGAALAIESSVASGQCEAAGSPASCNLPGSASMTAGRVVLLEVSAASTALTAPIPADFDAGFNSTTGPTLSISANASWALSLRSTTPLWTATSTSPGAPARTDKPVADLTWSTNPAGPFAALTAANASLVSGAATASTVTTLYFRTLYSWLFDTPGNYGLTLVLTLTAP
jgi:hypothetical protein